MLFDDHTSDPRTHLVQAAKHFYQKGWMAGSAGNLSAKIDEDKFWITASGCAKGHLTTKDFVQIERQNTGEWSASAKLLSRPPSAETSIHQAIYDLFPQAQACFHVHSIPANLAGLQAKDQQLQLPPLEMIKGLGLWVENPNVQIPVFANYLDVPTIAAEIRQRLANHPPTVPLLLIENHGVTAWGNSLTSTFHHLEIAEYVFAYMVARQQME
jgi:methylthioribulose-1-phosphate dehydratase